MQNTLGWSPEAHQAPEPEARALAWSCEVGTLTVLLVWRQWGLEGLVITW